MHRTVELPLPQPSSGEPVGGRPDVGTSPATRLLDRYLGLAVDAGASDIHFEPGLDGAAEPRRLEVRIRVDGHLRPLEAPPTYLGTALLTRMRLLARADLSECRLPQDGRFSFRRGGREIEVRAAFMPVHGGERVALRLLRSDGAGLKLDDLGMDPDDYRLFSETLGQACGMTVVVGPTGSGKTTTLYAALAHLRSPHLSILAVEDPVERDIPGVAQVAVDDEAGRTFAIVLRSALRHDPDILMVGEIRDPESARIACNAALTGHRVLTTLHAADTAETLLRLADMGIADYLLAATVRLVVAQRLVRRLCPRCKTLAPASRAEAALFAAAGLDAPDAVAVAGGCRACAGQGFRGRMAIFEMRPRQGQLQQTAAPRPTLIAAGLSLAATGATTIEEVMTQCPP